MTMTTENLVNCHCQLSITLGHGVKVVKVKLVKVGFVLQLLQLQLEKHRESSVKKMHVDSEIHIILFPIYSFDLQ